MATAMILDVIRYAADDGGVLMSSLALPDKGIKASVSKAAAQRRIVFSERASIMGLRDFITALHPAQIMAVLRA